jgi:hypothetical protein
MVVSEYGGAFDDMAQLFVDRMAQYQGVLQKERGSINLLSHDVPLGARTLVVTYPVDSNNRPQLEKATVSSLAQARAKIMTDLVDALVSRAHDKVNTNGHLNPEDVVAYGLLSLVPQGKMIVHLKIDVTKDANSTDPHQKLDGFDAVEDNLTGADAKPIGAGLFDVDAIMSATDASQDDSGD